MIKQDAGWLTFNLCIIFNQIYIHREYTGDLVHPLFYTFVPAHALLSDDDHFNIQLLSCNLNNTFDYKFRSNSLPDLTQEEYRINFDPNFEKRNVKYKRIINEIQFNDSDYDSQLNDIGI